MILSFPVKIVTDGIIKSILNVTNSIINYMMLSMDTIKPVTKLFLLFIFISLTTSMVITPHQKAINIDNKDVLVDTHYKV